ncbi:MAG: M24 family metallopeptidase [Planctomycetota bacterium]|nr:M24 family metallopeptidase [Planctomycetota bacterium]MDA1106388.1 M24 family metallopeptidase [Planctomycetota bacterium]
MAQPPVAVFAGIPASNLSLFWQIRFSVGDPAALVINPGGGDRAAARTLLIRDIEVSRARQSARADEVFAPGDFEISGGLSGDREVATAQALAECLTRRGIQAVRCDRSLPALFWHHLVARGISVTCDQDLGVLERRAKDAQEVGWLREAQAVTERAMDMACRIVGRARAGAGGVLQHDGTDLTSERLRSIIDVWLLERGYENPTGIVAGGPQGADCHDHGHGTLRTGEPVIVDIFPRNKSTRYWGDCTRTVVHGGTAAARPELVRMHAAVVEAKAAATAATRAGVTGEAVHGVTARVMAAHGFAMGLPAEGERNWCRMTHGTGHGIGLEVHEPPLLAAKGPMLVVGDTLTIEPGLYADGIGGVRVEDMVIVTEDGCESLNSIPEGLDWE